MGTLALRGQARAGGAAEQARLAALEATLARNDAIIAEVSEEYLAVKEGSSGNSGTDPAKIKWVKCVLGRGECRFE